jgi:bifunctional non-homologous end joining protein LigD
MAARKSARGSASRKSAASKSPARRAEKARKPAVPRRKAAASTSARARRLPEYEAKRDFTVTPEPAPGSAAPSPGAPTFMVHKHDATRLHYDLRLELDGALASWAIPKGPSYDPEVKRLAVQTEDHPLEYGAFEGRIPDGEYGGGDSLIWDRGTWEMLPGKTAEEGRRKGHLHFALHGEKLHGTWHLVRTGRQQGTKAQWLFFKGKDDAADPRFDVVAERPESVVSGRRVTRGPERATTLRAHHVSPEKLLEAVMPPMLATLQESVPGPEDEWVLELKYDGFRALCAVSGGKAAMWSRNGLDLAARFPAVAKALTRLVVGDAVIDGEVIAPDASGVPRFERLQQGKDTALAAFDLLWLDGQDLRRRPLEERRDLLVSLLSNAPPLLRLAERLPPPSAKALEHAAREGHEGIVAKRRGTPYEGTRSRSWIKVKAHRSQELAVVGFTSGKGAAGDLGALLLGVAEGAGYRFAGRVGTGFTAKMRTEIRKALLKDRVEKPQVAGAPRIRDAVWVEPRLVAQVEFTEWTEDGMLRHPSFKGFRDDKAPSEAVREKPATAQRVQVELTSPKRVLWPRDRITKEELAGYYEAVSGPMLRALAERPLSLEHWNDGIDRPPWFQQDMGDHEPWMHLVATPTTSSTKRNILHLVADRPEVLRWLAQRSVLTLHTWLSREGSLRSPDLMVFDLDPAQGEGIAQTIEPARALKALLDELSVPSYPKTSGKRGLHVLVPLLPGHTFEDVVEFGQRIAAAITQVLPQTTQERSLGKRRGRLYLDVLQNAYGKTIVAPYSPRGVDGAPVSAPLAWDEVDEHLDPQAFTLRTMPSRLAKVGDLFAPALTGGVRLPRLK